MKWAAVIKPDEMFSFLLLVVIWSLRCSGTKWKSHSPHLADPPAINKMNYLGPRSWQQQRRENDPGADDPSSRLQQEAGGSRWDPRDQRRSEDGETLIPHSNPADIGPGVKGRYRTWTRTPSSFCSDDEAARRAFSSMTHWLTDSMTPWTVLLKLDGKAQIICLNVCLLFEMFIWQKHWYVCESTTHTHVPVCFAIVSFIL